MGTPAVKLHPHVKHFLRSVIYSELNDTIPTNSRKDWREGLLQELQAQVLSKLQDAKSASDIQVIVEQTVDEFKKEKLDRIMSVACSVLKATPLDTLKRQPHENTSR